MSVGAEYRARGWWRDTTILDDLRSAAAHHPDRAAVTVYHTDGMPPDRLSYPELAAVVRKYADALAALGVRRGDMVALQLPNSWRYAALLLATWQLGAAVVPVLMIMRGRELRHVLGLTGAKVVVAPAVHRGYDYGAMLTDVGADTTVVLMNSDGDRPGTVDFGEHFERTEHPAASVLPIGADDIAQVMFTSGTTGEPKGVVHSHNTLFAAMRGEALALGLTADDVIAMGSPLTHQAGFLYCVLMPIHLGARAVYQDAWDPKVMLDLVAAEGVTFGMGATTFLTDAIAEQQRCPRELATLTSYACGGSPVPPIVVDQASTVLGVRVYALWGMTENGTVTITRPQDPPDRAAGSDGTPVPWMWTRIVDDDGRPATSPSQVGRLQVRGASQCLGYHRRPEIYAANCSADGWFDTGDLARDDGFGGIRIAGRAKDLIIRGGENVPVVEVEAALLRLSGIRDVAVVGYPDDRLGERAAAIVVADRPLALDDLRAHLAELDMAKQYWPERLVQLDELPKTPSGKIQKFVLRGQITEGA
ncbi:MAG TPA: AMP-binding protein [Pseudonocardiaceae bacterium]|nr:AMP-binding protein [Pseudonocardiaceae bacterium]